jgi:hypothetical protein
MTKTETKRGASEPAAAAPRIVATPQCAASAVAEERIREAGDAKRIADMPRLVGAR